MALDQPPFVVVAGLSNFRDAGGSPILDDNGKKIASVRSGILYRGPDPNTIQPEGLAKLQKINVTTHFDLKSRGQIEKFGGPVELDGIQRIWSPAFPDGEYSPEKAAARYVQYASDGTEGIVQAFTDILVYGAPATRTILLHLASISPTSPSAFYIHCTTGNNRSGVFIGLILSLLGVKPQQIAEEYALSDIGLRPTRDAVIERLMKSPVFSQAGGGGRERAERMVGARPESMLAMLEMVHLKWGSAEGYVKTLCGLTDEDIRIIRELMVVKDKSERPTHQRQRSIARAWDASKEFLGRLRGSVG